MEEFARACVAGWIGWRVDAPPARRSRNAGARTREAVAAAVDALVAEQRSGYVEAVHHLRLPRGDGRYEEHPAVLSFRAVALDAMLDARDSGIAVPEAVLHMEALGILRSKHPLVRGGWSYLGGVPELPPDADDNGQVAQVLWRLGGRALARACEEPIRMSLDAAEPSGGIVTWILDPRGDTRADAIVRDYLPVMGGWGVHAEVVANFAYGLMLIDPARFAEPLQAIATYLEAVQNDDGSWTSKWYDGPYYGTFKAVAVLAHARPASLSLDRARAFVLSRRRPDGSFGDGDGDGDGAGGALATALALLALDELGLSGKAAFAAGIANVLALQDEKGRWPACPWIRFPTVDGEVSYGSETMTTAFCLKALTAGR